MSRETAFQKFAGKTAPPATTTMPDLTARPVAQVSPMPEPTPAAVATPPISADQDPAKAKADLESSRIAIFAKKEAAILRDREEIKKMKAEADAVIQREKEFEELWKKDPIQAMKSRGYSDTDIINFMNGTEKREPTAEETARRIAQEETQKITERIENDRKTAETAEQQRLITSLKTEIGTQIKTKSDAYEYCAFEGADAESKVYDLVSDLLQNNDTGMNVEEIIKASLDQAEEFFKQKDDERGKIKKRQPKVEEVISQPEPQTRIRTAQAPISNVPQPPTQQGRRVVGTIPPPPAGRRETAAEKRERLIQAIKTGGLTR